MNILLVEDDDSTREAILYVLTELGHGVVTAVDIKDATSKYANSKFDSVISDYQLGQWGTGLDLLQILKSKNPNVRFILITAKTNVELVISALRKGASDFLSKPLDLGMLEDALHRTQVAQEAEEKSCTLEAQELERIQQAINECPTLTEAAARLGIDTATLYRKRVKHNLKKAA